jgi:DNA invertase Pin-like site-specific DNA recombinase
MSEYIYKPPSTLAPGSTVIAYVRDSGGPNQQESKNQQLDVLSAYCKQYGLFLMHVYSDTASGRKTNKRDQFLQMFNSIMTSPTSSRPRGLLLWAYSRFSRDVTDFNYFLSGIQRQGVIVHSLTEEIPEGLTGQIILSLKAYKNADYSIELGKQIKRAIADNVRKGYSNGGQPPKGYILIREFHDNPRGGMQRIGIKWQPDPELAPLVRLAWEMRSTGKSYSEITKATSGKLYTVPCSWATHFKNKSYLGIGKASDLEIHDHHEALISWELWQAVRNVQEAAPRLGKRGDILHPRRMSNPSLLAGLAFCVYCNAAMILHTSKDYRCYKCGTHDRKKGYSECKESRSVNARKAETLIMDIILNRILSPEFVNTLLADVQGQMVDTSKLDREISESNNILMVNARAVKRLMKLAEAAGDLLEISDRLKELKREESEISAKVKRLKAEREVDVPQLTSEALELVFSTWRDQIRDTHKSGDILNTKRLITQFVKRIELSQDTAIIHYTYPVSKPTENALNFSAHKVP